MPAKAACSRSSFRTRASHSASSGLVVHVLHRQHRRAVLDGDESDRSAPRPPGGSDCLPRQGAGGPPPGRSAAASGDRTRGPSPPGRCLDVVQPVVSLAVRSRSRSKPPRPPLLGARRPLVGGPILRQRRGEQVGGREGLSANRILRSGVVDGRIPLRATRVREAANGPTRSTCRCATKKRTRPGWAGPSVRPNAGAASAGGRGERESAWSRQRTQASSPPMSPGVSGASVAGPASGVVFSSMPSEEPLCSVASGRRSHRPAAVRLQTSVAACGRSASMMVSVITPACCSGAAEAGGAVHLTVPVVAVRAVRHGVAGGRRGAVAVDHARRSRRSPSAGRRLEVVVGWA